MKSSCWFLLPLALALAACGRDKGAEPKAESQAPAPTPTAVNTSTATAILPLAQKKFGGEITEKTNTALDTLIGDPDKFTSKVVRTEGRVSAVCQEMGCWMEIADDAGKAHIKMAGHAFFVPKQASGHRAVVQGKVLASDKDHCTEEAEHQTGTVAKIEIEATGVEFLD